MPFELENGTDYIGLEIADQLWLENDAPSGGIKWPRCCCQGGPSGVSACGCSDVPTTLHLTDSVAGSCDLTYSSGHWTGTIEYTTPACTHGVNPCNADAVIIHYDFTQATCVFVATWKVAAFGQSDYPCPRETGTSSSGSGPISVYSTVCSPVTLTFQLPIGYGTDPDLLYCNAVSFLVDGLVTYTITA